MSISTTTFYFFKIILRITLKATPQRIQPVPLHGTIRCVKHNRMGLGDVLLFK